MPVKKIEITKYSIKTRLINNEEEKQNQLDKIQKSANTYTHNYHQNTSQSTGSDPCFRN